MATKSSSGDVLTLPAKVVFDTSDAVKQLEKIARGDFQSPADKRKSIKSLDSAIKGFQKQAQAGIAAIEEVGKKSTEGLSKSQLESFTSKVKSRTDALYQQAEALKAVARRTNEVVRANKGLGGAHARRAQSLVGIGDQRISRKRLEGMGPLQRSGVTRQVTAQEATKSAISEAIHGLRNVPGLEDLKAGLIGFNKQFSKDTSELSSITSKIRRTQDQNIEARKGISSRATRDAAYLKSSQGRASQRQTVFGSGDVGALASSARSGTLPPNLVSKAKSALDAEQSALLKENTRLGKETHDYSEQILKNNRQLEKVAAVRRVLQKQETKAAAQLKKEVALKKQRAAVERKSLVEAKLRVRRESRLSFARGSASDPQSPSNLLKNLGVSSVADLGKQGQAGRVQDPAAAKRLKQFAKDNIADLKARSLAAGDNIKVVKRLTHESGKYQIAVTALDARLKSLAESERKVKQLQAQRATATKKAAEGAKTQAKGVKDVAGAHKELNTHLGQGSLLIRQFFRFALGYGALYQVLGAVNALARGLVSLDKELYSLQAVAGVTDKGMVGIEASIKRVAITTKFTTDEIARTARVLAQAGVEADNIPKVLESVAQFAAATDSGLELAADLLTTMRNVFKDMDEIDLANQLTKAINISKLTAGDLKTILSLSSQIADSYNLTSEQYLAAATTLRNAGIKPSTVATGLRQAITELFTPSNKAIGALETRYKQLGENLSKATIKSMFAQFRHAENPLLSVLQELKRIGFADDAQALFGRSFNVRATNAITALIKNLDNLSEAEQRITFGQAAAEGSEIQMKSLANSLSNLGAAFTAFGDEVFGGGVRSLEGFVDVLTEAISGLVELDKSLKLAGEEGFAGTFAPGAVGAVAGGFLSKGVIGKVVGIVSGAVAGSAGSLAFQEEGVGSSEFVTALGLLGLAGSATGGKAKPKLSSASSLMKGGAKRAAQGKGAQAVKLFARALPRFLAGLGPLGIVLGIFSVVQLAASLFQANRTAMQVSADKVDAARGQLEDAEGNLQEVLRGVDEFDLDSSKGKGNAASGVLKIQEAQRDFSAGIRAVITDFDSLSQEAQKTILAAVEEYSSASLEVRGKVLLPKITGASTALSGKTLADLDQSLSRLSNLTSGMDGAISGVIVELQLMSEKAVEEVDRAIEGGIDLSDASQVFQNPKLLQALKTIEVGASSQQISDLIDGTSTLSRDERIKAIAAYITSIKESIQALSPELIAVRDAVKQNLQKETFKKILTLAGTKGVGDQVVKQALLAAVKDADFTDPDSLLQVWAEAQAERISELSGDAVGAEVIGQALLKSPIAKVNKYLGDIVSTASEQAEKLIESQRQETLSAIGQFESAQGGEDLNKVLKSNEAGSLSSQVAQVRKAGGDIPALRKKVEQAEVVDGKLSLPPAIESIVKIMELWRSFQASAFADKQAIKDAERLLSDPKAKTEISRLTKEINRGLRGKERSSLEDLAKTDDNDLISKRLSLQKKEQEKVLENIRRDLQGQQDDKSSKNLGTINRLKEKYSQESAKLAQFTEDALEDRAKAEQKLSERVHKAAVKIADARIKELQARTASEGFDNLSANLKELERQLLEAAEQESALNLVRGMSKDEALAQLQADKDRILSSDSVFDRFKKALNKVSEVLLEKARLLRTAPQTSDGGSDKLAKFKKYGVVPPETQIQDIENQRQAAELEKEASTKQRDEYQKVVDSGGSADLIEKASVDVERLSQEIVTLDNELAELARAAQEELGAIPDIFEGLDPEILSERLKGLDSDMSKVAEHLSDSVVVAMDEVGDALAGAILDGESFGDSMKGIFNSLAKDIATTLIKAGVNQMLQSLGMSLAFGGAATGGVVKAATGGVVRMATGGIIKGPGTGTSDSVFGTIVGKGGNKQPVRLSNGEAVLNAKATELLGDNFIHTLNSGKIAAFAAGGMQQSATAAKPMTMPSMPAPVVNQGETRIINAVDGPSVLDAALSSSEGARIILNHVKANKKSFQTILG